MEKCIEKISAYNILNNILPGVVFCYLSKVLLGKELIEGSIVDSLFTYYFIGMVVSRIGSLIIEPICKKTRIVKYFNYNDYMIACRKDEKIQTLSETNNIYRTLLALCITLILFMLFVHLRKIWCWFSDVSNWIVISGLILIFALSYRKQTKYVYDRVDLVCKGDK